MSIIRTVDRAFSILRHVAHHPSGQTVSKISTELGLAKSTVSRLLTTMEKWDMVQRDANNRFFLGDEPVRWISQQPKTKTLSSIVHPTLQQISDSTGEAVALCVREGLQVVYIDHVQGNHDVQVRDWTGEKLPLHATSSGKVLLAYAPSQTIDLVLSRPLQPYTGKTVASSTELSRRLEMIRERGYDIADEEYGEGIIGIGVPIHDQKNQIVASLNLYGPRFRLDRETLKQSIFEQLKESTSFLKTIIKASN